MYCKQAFFAATIFFFPGLCFAQSKACFVIGSTQSQVRNVQGTPKSVYTTEGTEIWTYGESSISFKNGIVTEFDNYSKNLRVCREVKATAGKELQEKQGFIFPERSKSKAGKAATEEWILEKLNQYVDKNIYTEGYYSSISKTQYPGTTQRNTSFSIEGNALMVRCQMDDGRSRREETYRIPISDLRRLHNDMGKLVLTAKTNSIEHMAGRESNKSNTFTIKFDFATEPDIKPRLVNAFAHLQKLSKTGQKKELF